MESKGFLAALFDFSFTRSVTLRVVGVLYLLGAIGIAIFGLLLLLGGLDSGGLTAVVSLVVVPLGALVLLLWWRITLEALYVFHQIAENTGETARNTAREAPGREKEEMPARKAAHAAEPQPAAKGHFEIGPDGHIRVRQDP